jgi:hypothetical protein
MLGPEAVEKAPYLPTGPVKPTQQSDRDKRQRFKDALKDELEDEQGRKRRRSPEDKLDLIELEKDEFERETAPEDEEPAEPETPEENDEGRHGETDQEDTDHTDSSETGHIDVKA